MEDITNLLIGVIITNTISTIDRLAHIQTFLVALPNSIIVSEELIILPKDFIFDIIIFY